MWEMSQTGDDLIVAHRSALKASSSFIVLRTAADKKK